MKIATWNVNSLNVRLPHVLRWLEDNDPDILGLQETKLTDDKFPIAEIEAAGYQVSFAGQKTYNGVAVISRTAATDVVTDLPGLDDPQRRVLCATVGNIRIMNLYIPNGQALDSPKFEYKMGWLTALQAYLEAQLAEHPKLIMMGDFNITTDDADVYDPDAMRDDIHCSPAERSHLNAMLDLGLTDTFRQFEQEPESFSWWDYRGGAFWKNRGLRIDYIMATKTMSEACTGCMINKRVRMRKQPSDHAPVVAEFDL